MSKLKQIIEEAFENRDEINFNTLTSGGDAIAKCCWGFNFGGASGCINDFIIVVDGLLALGSNGF